MRGQFITFEGGEGAGKTTQVETLQQQLSDQGIQSILTREPGGVPSAEILRDLVVKGDVDDWSVMAELLIITAGRVEHVNQKILPALEDGIWVLCDRFYDSSAVYQGVAGGLGLEKVMRIQKEALGDLAPDLTLVFDLPVEQGLKRAGIRENDTSSGEDRFERKGLDFHNKLRQGYLDIAHHYDRCQLIDAVKQIDEVANQIWQTVQGRLL